MFCFYVYCIAFEAFQECMLTKLKQIKQAIGEVKKEQAVLPSKMTLLIRASGVDGSPEELPGEIQFRLTGDRGLTFIEK